MLCKLWFFLLCSDYLLVWATVIIISITIIIITIIIIVIIIIIIIIIMVAVVINLLFVGAVIVTVPNKLIKANFIIQKYNLYFHIKFFINWKIQEKSKKEKTSI